MASGLNTTTSKNRLRFVSLSQRLQQVNVDVVHRVHASGSLDASLSAEPESGKLGCYFQDELEVCKQDDHGTDFRRFYHEIWPFVQSLPELLHHQNTIVDILERQLRLVEPIYLPSFLQLVAVMSRDLQEELYPNFSRLFSAILGRINDVVNCTSSSADKEKAEVNEGGGSKGAQPNIDVTVKTFECLSYLIKNCLSRLVEEPDVLRKYYGQMMGHSVAYVRDFSAKTMIILWRKLSRKSFSAHLRKVMKAVCVNVRKTLDVFDSQDQENMFEVKPIKLNGDVDGRDSSNSAMIPKVVGDIINGLTLSIFYVCKGVKDCLHSQAGARLQGLWEHLAPCKLELLEEALRQAKGVPSVAYDALPEQLRDKVSVTTAEGSDVVVFVYGRLLSVCLPRLFRHAKPANFLELWTFLGNALQELSLWWELLAKSSGAPQPLLAYADRLSQYVLELAVFALCHSGGRGLSDRAVRHAVGGAVVRTAFALLESIFTGGAAGLVASGRISCGLILKAEVFLCKLWAQFPDDAALLRRMDELLPVVLRIARPRPMIDLITHHLYGKLPIEIMKRHLLRPTLNQMATPDGDSAPTSWLSLLLKILSSIRDCREFDVYQSRRPSGSSDADTMEVESSNENSVELENVAAILQGVEEEITLLATRVLTAVSGLLGEKASSPAADETRTMGIVAVRCLLWLQCIYPSCLSHKSNAALYRSITTAVLGLHKSPQAFSSGIHKLGRVLLAHTTKVLCLQSEESLAGHYGIIIKGYVAVVAGSPESISLSWGLLSVLASAAKASKGTFDMGLLLDDGEIKAFLCTVGRALVTPSHWLRTHLLRVLAFFPQAVLQNRDSSKKQSREEAAHFDAVGLCLEAATLAVTLDNERPFARIVGNLEVVVRGARLPEEYECIVTAFCMGMLSVKFKPFWEPCVLVIIASAAHEVGEGIVWPQLISAIEYWSASTDDPADEGKEDDGEDDGEGAASSPLSFLSYLARMLALDDGLRPFGGAAAGSLVFYHAPAGRATGSILVAADSRTDCDTAYASTWDVLKRCPFITLKRSRHVVPLFLRFLRHQYYETFSDDAELPFLHRIGLFDSADAYELDTAPCAQPTLSHKVLKSRLTMFLAVFSAVATPKQLYQHQLLFKYFNAVLSKPDPSVASLALECVLHYKPPYALAHKDTLKRLLEDRSFRDELVVFDPSESGAVDPQNRAGLLPMLTRLLYGRFVSRAKKSKAARDKGISRRIAVLSFLSRVRADELAFFVHLMLRGLVPAHKLMACAKRPPSCSIKVSGQPYHEDLQEELRQWCAETSELTLTLKPEDMAAVYPGRLSGFLFLLEHVIKVLGHGATAYVHILFQLVATILLFANESRAEQKLSLNTETESEQRLIKQLESGEAEEEEEDAKRQDFLRLRTLALLRAADLAHQFHEVPDFHRWAGGMFETLAELVLALPSSMSGSKHPPALLKLINAFAQYEETSVVVCRDQNIVVSLIRCIAERSDVTISKMIVETIDILISYDSGKAIIPHANIIVSSFCERFTGIAFDDSTELKISELSINPSIILKQELKLLCRIAEEFFSKAETSIKSTYVSNLATLLLGMLRAYTHSRLIRAEEDWAIDILRVYKTLVWRMHDVRSHVAFISRLFGPATHSQSLFNFISVRKSLVSVYAEMCSHPSSEGQLTNSLKALEELTAQDPGFLGNRDFDRAMAVFQSLSGEARGQVAAYTWTNLLGPGASTARGASSCTVVGHECLRCMYDSELVVRSAALASLKSLVNETIAWSGLRAGAGELAWLETLTSLLVPGVRRGLKQSSDVTKRGFILLLGHVVSTVGRCEGHGNPEGFHSDLAILWHEDPEQNFFENICHIQIHRRVRALAKLRALLEDLFAQAIGTGCQHRASFSTCSLVHVLLPLAQHPLFSEEFLKKDHLTYMQEAAAFVGAIALHLPWTHYFASIKTLLKQLDRDRKDRERVLITALCSILDSFHFAVRSDSVIAVMQNDRADPRQPLEIHDADESDDADILKDVGDNAMDVEVDPAAKIYNIVITTLMPWVRVFLLKNGLDHKGNKTKTVRTPIAVALAKLLKKLETALSDDKKKELFANLLINVVGTLKSRDTSARDTARDSLVKILQTMGMGSLQSVLYELKHSLREGYQRHVGSYSVRSLLSIFMQKYTAKADAPSAPIVSDSADLDFVMEFPEFDKCIPLIVECVLEDLAGATHEDREVEGATRSVIREAKGSKANDILEVTSRCLLFRPSYALKSLSSPSAVSSIHALTTPILLALTDCESPETIGRFSEALQRIAIGLSLNASVSAAELMLYMHATLEPFVALIVKENASRKKALGRIVRNNLEDEAPKEEEAEEDIEDELPSYLREDSSDEEEALYSTKKAKGDTVTGYNASTWLPSERDGTNNRKAAIEAQKQAQDERTRVQDGASAPKMTGFNRHRRGKAGGKAGAADLNPAAVAAVKFCLTLFNAALRQNILDGSDPEIRAMAMPFLPLLGHCLKFHGATSIVAWSMRSLCALLTWRLPTDPQFSRAVASRILKLMFRGGALLSTDTDLVQACLKGLHSIFQMYNDSVVEAAEGGGVDKKPLSDEKLRLLIQLLTVSIMEITSGYQNATFQLIKSIIDTKFLVPEIYSLVTVLMDQIVLSQRAGIRESSSTTIISFILNYPLGEKRLESHMKQLVANCSYEYEEGRLSAFDTLINLAKLLPLPILEDYMQLLFMSMAMRLVNDTSSKCREAAAQIITTLARRASAPHVDSLVAYGVAWLSDLNKGPDARPLVRTGAQVVGILLTARPDVFKHSGHAPTVVSHVASALFILTSQADEFKRRTEGASSDIPDIKEGGGGGCGAETWAITYHLLCLLEQLYKALPTIADLAVSQTSGNEGTHVMYTIQECMLFPHSWVRGVSCRVLKAYLEMRDASAVNESTSAKREVLSDKNTLYQIARRLCVVLNQPSLADSLLHSVTYCLSFTVLAMHYHPYLCEKIVHEPGPDEDVDTNDDADAVAEDNDEDDDDDKIMDVDSDEELVVNRSLAAASSAEVNVTSPGGASWVMNRLRWLGANNRGDRRLYVIKILKSLIALSPVELLEENMDRIIEVPIRVQLTTTGPDEEALKGLKEHSLDLLNAIEAKIGSSSFIGAYSEGQRRLQHIRHEIKRKIAAEAIITPAAHSARKLQKTRDKLISKKRKDMKRANPAITGLNSSRKKRREIATSRLP